MNMMKMISVGIDRMAFSTSRYTFDLTELARVRGVDSQKFSQGLGQYQMSVPPPDEDIVTLGASAAHTILQDQDISKIDMLLFATESGIDQSKAAGLYVHQLLHLPERCRVLELKQACYSATAALQLSMNYLRIFPERKILLIASDIARYGLGSAGESSQGCGAAAMLLSAHPKLISIDLESGFAAESAMDFWRPNYRDEALVEGKYSSKLYLSMLEKTWKDYSARTGLHFSDHEFICYHTPVPRLVEKAQHYLMRINQVSTTEEQAAQAVHFSLHYNRQIGNSYTASLYISLISLLEQNKNNLSGKRIGFYSYGSGSVAEFFSGVVQPDYQHHLFQSCHDTLLAKRIPLSYEQYVYFYQYALPKDGSAFDIPEHATGVYRLSRIAEHKRIYGSSNLSSMNIQKFFENEINNVSECSAQSNHAG